MARMWQLDTAGRCWRWQGLHTVVDVWHWPVLKHRQPCEALAGWSTFRSVRKKVSRVVELKKLADGRSNWPSWDEHTNLVTAHGFVDISANRDYSGIAAMFTEDRCQKLRDGGMMLEGIWQVSVFKLIGYRFHFPISHPSCPQHQSTIEENWDIKHVKCLKSNPHFAGSFWRSSSSSACRTSSSVPLH